MSNIKLTKQIIKDLLPEGVAKRYFDSEVNGLFVRIHPTGKKSYGVRYLEKGTNRKKEKILGPTTLISLLEARNMAKRFLAEIICGNVIEDKARMKMRQLIEEYYSHCTLNGMRRTTLEQKLVLANKYVLPSLGDKNIGEINRIHIQPLLKKIAHVDGRKPTSRAVRTYLIGLFKYAISCGYIEVNPAKETAVFGTEVIRSRNLSENEIQQLWGALNCYNCKASDCVKDAVKILLYTGARSTEVSDMQWEELDFENRRWTIPASRNKSKREFVIFLTDEILEVLGNRQRKNSGPVFKLAKKSITQYLKRKSDGTLKMQGGFEGRFTAHDLRRTFATKMAENLKVNEVTIERLLNHASGAGRALKHYNKYAYEEEKQEALVSWCRFLSQLNGDKAI